MQSKEKTERALSAFLRPEFINRIDEIIFFRALGEPDLKRIASLILTELTDRIENNGIFIEFDERITDAVVKGCDREFGARPLRRAVTRLIETPFSEAMLKGEISRGDFIFARFDGENVLFEKKSAQ